MPWLLVGAGFLVGAGADTVWAYINVHGAFAGGGLVDPLWILAYGLVGCSSFAVRGDAGLRSASRLAPARWESLGAYVPVSLAVVAALVQQVRDQLVGDMFTFGIILVAVLVLRHVLAILENHSLAQKLEIRVLEATAELRTSEEHFRSIVGSISDVVVVIGADYRVRYVSPSATAQLGYDEEELLGKVAGYFLHPDDLPRTVEAVAAAIADPGGVHTCAARGQVKDGTWRQMEASITSLLHRPEVEGVVFAMRGIEERVGTRGAAAPRGPPRRPDRPGQPQPPPRRVGPAARGRTSAQPAAARPRRVQGRERHRRARPRRRGARRRRRPPARGDPSGRPRVTARRGRVRHVAARRPERLRRPRCGRAGAAGPAYAARRQGPPRPLPRQHRCRRHRGPHDRRRPPAGRRHGHVRRQGPGQGTHRASSPPTMHDDVVRRQRIEEMLRTAVLDRRLELHFQPIVDLPG